ncbi:MAG: hypothetical protein ACOZBL_04080 [Patescibacteria group bacterium]
MISSIISSFVLQLTTWNSSHPVLNAALFSSLKIIHKVFANSFNTSSQILCPNVSLIFLNSFRSKFTSVNQVCLPKR